jgi:epsilon-lactone hydrolase
VQGSTTDRTSTGYVAIHPLDPEDAAITASMRAMVSSSKGARPGIDARGQFDALMESVLPRGDVTFEADTLGGALLISQFGAGPFSLDARRSR